MIDIIYELLTIEILFIIALFIKELGIAVYIYEEIYTNPKLKPFIKLFGDVLYMIGGGVIASVAYAYTTTMLGLQINPTVVGVLFITYGAYLKR